MNLSETARALALVQAFDQRTVGDADVIAWQGVLADATLADVEEAVRQHYAEETGRIMPAHIRRAVRDMVSQREMARTATPWAPGQYGVLKADAMPEVAGPVDENALTPSVRALLDATRAMLPEGSREALMPRRVAWEKEFAAQERQKNAVPNPHYRPMAFCPGGVQAWNDFDHAGAVRHQNGSFCGHDANAPLPHECLIKDGRCLVKGHEHYLTEQEKTEAYGSKSKLAEAETVAKVHAHHCADCTFTSAKAEVLDHHMARTGHVEGI